MNRRRLVGVVAMVAVVTALVVVWVVTCGDDPDPEAGRPVATTTPFVAPSTTPPVAPPDEVADDPVVRATVPPAAHPWRVGYAGVGPIELGMTVDDAARVADASVRPTDGGCLVALDPLLGSELLPEAVGLSPGVVDVVMIRDPSFYTISGIHIGSTEAEVRRTYSPVGSSEGSSGTAITIADAAGRILYFWVADGVVRTIDLATSEKSYEGLVAC